MPMQDDMSTQIGDKEAKILELQDALELSRRGKHGGRRVKPDCSRIPCSRCSTGRKLRSPASVELRHRFDMDAGRGCVRCAEYDEMVSDKDRIIRDRDMEIEQLQKKMEDMSTEFAEMLKQTLDRMSQKIEQESAVMGAGDTDPTLSAKLSEFKLGFVDI